MTRMQIAPRPAILATLCAAALLVDTPLRVWAQASTVVAHDAWAREPPPSRDVTGLFVVLENSGGSLRSVVSASSDAADKVELHEMKMTNGMMSMSPVKQIDVPAGGKTELKPGGLHVMMFGLKKRPVPGDTLSVTLTLDDGTKVPVTATVRKAEMP
jgi:copper(I)-binding protein